MQLPAYQFRMLEHLAQKRRVTIAHLIALQLEHLAGECSEELSANIPGFAEAMDWPQVDPESVNRSAPKPGGS